MFSKKHVSEEHFHLLDEIKHEKNEHKIESLCKKDIALAKKFAAEWTEEENRRAIILRGVKPAAVVMPVYPSFSKLAIIYERQGKIKEAITICEQAIELGFIMDGTKGGMPGRIEKLRKKAGMK